MQPLLSVVTITYNHAPYIAKCIEGVLMQQVNFPMEFIVAEDCSTDGTRAICEEYAKKYPDLIRLLPSEGNMGAVMNEQRAFEAARGKYIATCEGDDYWTNPLKLQKQVDFLESHSDYSVCFHRFKRYHANDETWESDHCENLFYDGQDSVEISMHQFMHQWVTQYLTMVFRKDCYDFEAYKRYRYFRDTHQMYHLLLNGRCRLMAFEGGVYHMTGGGEYSTRDAFHQEQMTLNVDSELWKVNKDDRWKEMCTIVMQDMIDNFAEIKGYRHALLKYALSIRAYGGETRKFIKNCLSIMR